MYSPRQLLQSTRLDGVSSVLKMSYGGLGNSGLARQKLSGELFCFCPDPV